MTLETPPLVHSDGHARTYAHPSSSPSISTTPSPPTSLSDGDGGRGEQTRLLVGKGLSPWKARQIAASFDADRIRDGIAHFEQLSGVGPGVLAIAIEEGRKPSRKLDASSPQSEIHERLRGFVAWCHEHLGDVCGPELNVGAWRAWWRMGQPPASRLSVEAHGPVIRHWVELWEQECL